MPFNYPGKHRQILEPRQGVEPWTHDWQSRVLPLNYRGVGAEDGNRTRESTLEVSRVATSTTSAHQIFGGVYRHRTGLKSRSTVE